MLSAGFIFVFFRGGIGGGGKKGVYHQSINIMITIMLDSGPQHIIRLYLGPKC